MFSELLQELSDIQVATVFKKEKAGMNVCVIQESGKKT